MVKINMGCGWRNFGSEWIHIDGGDYKHLDSKDITKLSFEDNSVDLIYASHILEYFDRETASEVLLEWNRALKPGAVLRLAVPDFEPMAHLYSIGDYSLDSFLGPLYGKMNMGDATIYHKTVYDFVSLESILRHVGFEQIVRYDWQETDHGHIDDHSQAYLPHMDKESGTLMSLNIECKKVRKI